MHFMVVLNELLLEFVPHTLLTLFNKT